MSVYRRGKQEVAAWASYWINYHNLLNSGSSVEGKMAEYGQPIRAAFDPNRYNRVDEAASRTPWYIAQTHAVVMTHPARELCIAWYFASPEIMEEDFPEINISREPNSLKNLYRKVGRKFEKGR